MATISFSIPTENLERIKTAMTGLYPIPTIPDPENEGQTIPEFTESEWAKEAVRRFVKKSVARYEQMIAKDAIVYNEEDDLLS